MAIKIYKVKVDLNKYYSLVPSDRELWKKHRDNLFKGSRMLDEWDVSNFYVNDPINRKKGNFFYIHSGAFAFDQRVLDDESLGSILRTSGEILEGFLEDTKELIYILNIPNVYNCLDRENTERRTALGGEITVQIYKYAFYPERIGSNNIFKIPEMPSTAIYALSGRDEKIDEFYAQYHKLDFRGLTFEEIWSE